MVCTDKIYGGAICINSRSSFSPFWEGDSFVGLLSLCVLIRVMGREVGRQKLERLNWATKLNIIVENIEENLCYHGLGTVSKMRHEKQKRQKQKQRK